jgi:hypothetical protein
MLPDFILSSRVNQCWQYNGIDSPDQCRDKKHFKSYPHKISYHYNSRGFRDQEWPDSLADLQDAVWCVGDSFTVGIGSPLEHTWSYQVGQQLKTRTINVSMDGASNQWIVRKALDIIKHVAPKLIIIQWSYIHRVEIDNSTLTDEKRRLPFDNTCQNHIDLGYKFVDLVQQVEVAKQNTKVIHSFIPEFGIETTVFDIWTQLAGPTWPPCPKTLKEFNELNSDIVNELANFFKRYDIFKIYYSLYHNIQYLSEIRRLDLARDGHHYDILTAQQFAIGVRELLNRRS